MDSRITAAIRDALTATDWDGDLPHIESMALALAFEALDSEQDLSPDHVAALFMKVSEIIIALDGHGDAKVM